MNSFVIWYKGPEKKKAKVNINLWKTVGNSSYPYCIDIGLLVYECRDIEYIEVLIPNHIDKEDIIDLGKKMISGDGLASAIFNSEILLQSARPDHEKLEQKITITDSDTNVLLLSFLGSSHYKIEYHENDTILRIDTQKLLDEDSTNIYFRFRIRVKDSTLITFDEKPKYWFFQSAITCTETIEFRLNDHRLFSRFIIEQLEKHTMFILDKTHLFIMRDSTDELLDEHDLKDIRLLENDIWKDYIDGMKVAEKTIAYHYKKEKESDDVSFFTRIKYSNVKFHLLAIYVFAALFLAILANLLTDLIKSKHIFGPLFLFAFAITIWPGSYHK